MRPRTPHFLEAFIGRAETLFTVVTITETSFTVATLRVANRYVHSRVFRLVPTLIANSDFDFQRKTNWFRLSLVSLLVSSATAAGSSDFEVRCNPSHCQCRSVVCSQSLSMTSSVKDSLPTRLASARKSAMAKAIENCRPPKSHLKPTPADEGGYGPRGGTGMHSDLHYLVARRHRLEIGL
jgi:hypothetical protein